MKPKSARITYLKYLLAGCILAGGGSVSFAEFKSGVATRIVTPEPLLPVSGGVGASHPTSKKQGDLTVRALVLENGGVRVAIVGADFLGFPSVLGNRVREKVSSEVRAENVLIGSTHTHSAPDCYGFPDGKGGSAADPQYLGIVVRKMVEAIKEAVTNLAPTQLRIATGEAKGKIAYNYYAEQLYDPRCHVLQTVDKEGKPICTLVNYAIHPEVIGSNQGILGPDLIGPLYDEIKNKGGGTAIFMNSAQGGMVTADCRGPNGKDIRTPEECVRIGQLLANEALRIVQKTAPMADPNIYCAARPVSFPVESPLLLQVMKNSPLGMQASSGNHVSTQMNLINIGNAQILTIPGEALPNIGFYLKRKMKGEHNLLFGLTNDAFGYILTKVDFNSFKRYDYVSRTSLGENTGEILIDEALKFIEQSPKPK